MTAPWIAACVVGGVLVLAVVAAVLWFIGKAARS